MATRAGNTLGVRRLSPASWSWALVVWFFVNIGSAIQDRDIPYGFGFLSREYQTPIGEHFIPYESSDTFLYALIVAITNTLIVSVAGVILATLLGIFIGIARLSSNWLVSKIALVYIEFFRNVPLLVQLLFWFFIVLTLPRERDAYNIAGQFYFSNSGISTVWPVPVSWLATGIWVALAALSVLTAILVNRRLARREAETGKQSYPLLGGWATAIILVVFWWIVVSVAMGVAPLVISSPETEGQFMRISGGFTVRAGLLVLLIGLTMYTAAFIAENRARPASSRLAAVRRRRRARAGAVADGDAAVGNFFRRLCA